MEKEGLARGMRTVAADLDEVLRALIAASPDQIQQCAVPLEAACREMKGLSAEVTEKRGRMDLMPALLDIRRKIADARRLLDRVGLFHQSWGQILGSRTGGYVAGGHAAPVHCAARVLLRG